MIPCRQERPLTFYLSCPLLFAFLCLVGCSREVQLTYTAREEALELPSLHQEQLEEALTSYFGTPTAPRLLVPDGFSEDEEPLRRAVVDEAQLAHGAAVYRRRCASCHGVTGDGQGEAAPYLNPKPRDYRRGVFKFISTTRGARPRRGDLVRTVRRGAKGTSMPSFRWLSSQDLNAVVDYVIHLSFRGELEFQMAAEIADEYDEDQDIDPEHFDEVLERIDAAWDRADTQLVLPLTAQPQVSESTIAAGRAAFQAQACAKCHGEDGKGQTDWLSPRFLAEQEALPADQRVAINYDDWGNVAPAADLTAGMLHGGRRPIDIYRRIHSGINGTPMPAFSGMFQENPDTMWHLVHFVLSVVDGQEFEPVETAAQE